jgi:uncharacterized protein (DUF433 family)
MASCAAVCFDYGECDQVLGLGWYPNVRREETSFMAGARGPHIVADPAICHGEPTFRGTRILVTDVLEQVASGMAWEAIVDEWRGALTQEAITEALLVNCRRPR